MQTNKSARNVVTHIGQAEAKLGYTMLTRVACTVMPQIQNLLKEIIKVVALV